MKSIAQYQNDVVLEIFTYFVKSDDNIITAELRIDKYMKVYIGELSILASDKEICITEDTKKFLNRLVAESKIFCKPFILKINDANEVLDAFFEEMGFTKYEEEGCIYFCTNL